MNRWNDGRSGEAGCIAGNLVLDHLDPSGHRIQHIRGTVFGSNDSVWIGRVVGDESYLHHGVLHWANNSWDQHTDWLREVKQTKRKLIYLFITARVSEGAVQYWQVPAAYLTEELERRRKNVRGAVLGLHISLKGDQHLLGLRDVTSLFHEVKIDPGTQAELRAALARDARPRNDTSAPGPNLSRTIEREQVKRSFPIPLSGGNEALLEVSLPMTQQDVARLKGWLELMGDVLIENA
jgi:hypothetical protein